MCNFVCMYTEIQKIKKNKFYTIELQEAEKPILTIKDSFSQGFFQENM